MSKEFGAKSKSSIAILLYSINGEEFISRALSNIFPERSMPKAKVAPRSMAYRQCQPKPHPKSNTRFPLKSGNIFFSSCHSPAPLSPCTERDI